MSNNGRTSKRRRNAAWKEFREQGVVENEHIRKRCESCDKIIYNSKQDARGAFTGQFNSKSLRVYPCSAHNGYHVTKDWKNKR